MQQTDGYISDLPYPPHFYKEMQPLWLTTVATFLDCAIPDISQPFSYCELGCGMGINLLVAAATNPAGYFVGVDFNERHIAIARTAVEFTGLRNIHFIHADFSTFAQHNNTGFDFITCHGTWSWIATQHQQTIIRIAEKALKPDGLFYLHYMSHPGATHLLPIQKLLNEFAKQTPGNGVQKIQQAMLWLQHLVNAGAFIDQPQMVKHIHALGKKDMHYLAHEFLTDHWNPQHSSDVHQYLLDAGLNFIGSANVFENNDELSVPGNIQPLLAGLAPAAQETLRDLARNQHQRMDIFQKKNSMPAPNAIDNIMFQTLPNAPVAGGFGFKTPIGEIPAPAEIFSPLLQLLAKKPATTASLRQLPLFFHQPALLAQALQMLMWAEYIHPQPPISTTIDNTPLHKLNAWLNKNSLAINVIGSCSTAVKTR